MNNSIMFDVARREELFAGVHQFPDGWKLKLFFITAQGVPFATMKTVKDVLTDMLGSITKRLSNEFEYGRFGFAIIHTGRRGVCISIWHFGSWGTTFEFFSSVWYRYGHGFDNFELLNDVEPAFCWFEFERTRSEFRAIFKLAETLTLNKIRESYFSIDSIESKA